MGPHQGAGCDVDEYLARLRRLRWQAMAVRGEVDEPQPSLQARTAMGLLGWLKGREVLVGPSGTCHAAPLAWATCATRQQPHGHAH